MKLKNIAKFFLLIFPLVIIGVFVFGHQLAFAVQTCCCKVDNGNVSDCAYYDVPAGSTCQLKAGGGAPPPNWEERAGECSKGCCRCSLEGGKYSRCEDNQTDNECVDLGISLGVNCEWAAGEPCSMYTNFCSRVPPSTPTSTSASRSTISPTGCEIENYVTSGEAGLTLFEWQKDWLGFLPPCAACGNCQLIDFLYVVAAQFNIVLAIFGGIALAFMVFGGVRLLLSAGNPEAVQSGKRIVVHTIVGILLMLSSWLIVNLILVTLTGNEAATIFKQDWYKPFADIPLTAAPTAATQPGPTGPTPPATGACGVDARNSCGGSCGNFQVKNESGQNVEQECPDASPGLKAFLADLYQGLSDDLRNTLVITSISDNPSDGYGYYYCRTDWNDPQCDHSRNSCHYGGGQFDNGSYAADFRKNLTSIQEDTFERVVEAEGGTFWPESGCYHVSISECPKT